jgi:ubiquitin-protein ligase
MATLALRRAGREGKAVYESKALQDMGIYYRINEDNIMKGTAMLVGKEDTPYVGGFYFFDVEFPSDYPHAPMKVKSLTQDGKTRFNPNLYTCGKVCVSILNTWSGEKWSSCQTINSILLTLCTLLNNEPLLNEPGQNNNKSDFIPYHKSIQYTNINYAICDMIIHNKTNKSTECFYGTTNYADPRDMTNVDYNVFMLNYPPNFTLQDYVNWLWCYQNKKDKLPYNHLRNLEKLELGKELKAEEGVLPPPGYYFPPMNAEDYFNTLYNDKNEFNIAEPLNSTTASMLGYNYNDYSEFSQNRDVYGTSGELRNPDIGLKKTANEVDTYIIPHDSENLEIEHKYKPYRVKKIEI